MVSKAFKHSYIHLLRPYSAPHARGLGSSSPKGSDEFIREKKETLEIFIDLWLRKRSQHSLVLQFLME